MGVIINPYAKRVPIRLHPGQFEVYSNPARFKVIASGRRWGKCVKIGAMIAMADGTFKHIEDIRPGDRVVTVNENSYDIESRRVQHLLDNGVRETLKIRTRTGRELEVTPNHPILANNAWTEARNIVSGSLVAVPRALGHFGTRSLPDHVVDFLAIWLAEGSVKGYASATPVIIEIMNTAAAEMGVEFYDSNWRSDRVKGLNWNWRGISRGTNEMIQLLRDLGLWGKNSKTKFIPECIFALPKPQLARFLNVFFACDGNISRRSKNTWSLEVGLANKRMVSQLRDLLHRFGIRGSLRHKVHAKQSSVTGKHFESWSYICSTPDCIRIFAEEIGCVGKEDQLRDALEAGSRSRGNCNDYLPISHDEFVQHLRYEPTYRQPGQNGHSHRVAEDLPFDLSSKLKSWRKQTPERVSRYRYNSLRGFSDDYFDLIAEGGVAWEEVDSVTENGRHQTFDLCIEGNHNFIAEGIVTHNTSVAKSHIIDRASIPRQLIWYVAPSYRMAKEIMWHDLLDTIPRRWMLRKPNETSMTIYLINRTLVKLKGADRPDSLRGVGLNYLVLDEVQDLVEDAWTKVLRPTLATTKGHALFVGSPKGYQNLLYKLWLLGQNPANQRSLRWHSWQFRTADSPFVPLDEIEQARQDMDEKSFRQEFLGSFESVSGRVYYTFDRNVHVGQFPFNPNLPIWVGQDFNLSPMCSAILQPQPSGEVWAVDEIYRNDSNVVEIADELEKRYWRHLKRITIYPDPAGATGQHARGESSLDIFREKGFKRIKYHRKHPPVADRTNAVNRMLRAADGSIRFRVDARCRNLIASLEQTLYCDDGSREIDKDLNIEHMTDALGYPLQYEFPSRKIEVAGISL